MQLWIEFFSVGQTYSGVGYRHKNRNEHLATTVVMVTNDSSGLL